VNYAGDIRKKVLSSNQSPSCTLSEGVTTFT